jgi:hypothetical protein
MKFPIFLTQKITALGAPTNNTDSVNEGYVDALVARVPTPVGMSQVYADARYMEKQS